MTTDPTLCKIVHRETFRGHEILAHLTRFGGLAVFVDHEHLGLIWQGDSILDARAFVTTHCDGARRAAQVERARHERHAYWHALAKAKAAWKGRSTGDAALDRYLDTL